MTSTPSSSYVPSGPQGLLFRKALRRFPSGVTVVTVGDGARARGMTAGSLFHGMTASSFAAVSLDPSLLAVSVNKPGLMHQLLALTDGMYGVSVLAHDQVDVADFFARLPWKKIGKLPVERHGGCPVIAGALAWFVCRKWATYDGGDRAIFVGESIQNGASDRPDLGPLLWHESDYHTLGSPLTRGGRSKASDVRR